MRKPTGSKTTAAGLRHAIRMGWRGEHYTEEHTPSKIERAARLVTRLATLQPSVKEVARMDKEWHAEKTRVFESAAASAKGLNREVMAILRDAADMPGERTTEPLSTSISIPANYKGGPATGGVQWHRNFSRNGTNPSEMFGGSVPLANQGDLRIKVASDRDGREIVDVPINTLSIRYHAPATVDGERHNVYASDVHAGSTTLIINERPYDPDNTRLYTRSSGRSEINYDGTPDGHVEITIGPEGAVSGVRIGRNNLDGPEPITHTATNTGDMLIGLRNEIFATNQQLAIPDDVSSLQGPRG